jgi:hypothetical protein
MLQYNLLDTAVTRGRNKVFIVGDAQADSLAAENRKASNVPSAFLSISKKFPLKKLFCNFYKKIYGLIAALCGKSCAQSARGYGTWSHLPKASSRP